MKNPETTTKKHIVISRAELENMLRQLDDYETRKIPCNCVILHLASFVARLMKVKYSWTVGTDDRLGRTL